MIYTKLYFYGLDDAVFQAIYLIIDRSLLKIENQHFWKSNSDPIGRQKKKHQKTEIWNRKIAIISISIFLIEKKNKFESRNCSERQNFEHFKWTFSYCSCVAYILDFTFCFYLCLSISIFSSWKMCVYFDYIHICWSALLKFFVKNKIYFNDEIALQKTKLSNKTQKKTQQKKKIENILKFKYIGIYINTQRCTQMYECI